MKVQMLNKQPLAMEPIRRIERLLAAYKTAALPLDDIGMVVVPHPGFEPGTSGLEDLTALLCVRLGA